jgi:hypothetical protein
VCLRARFETRCYGCGRLVELNKVSWVAFKVRCRTTTLTEAMQVARRLLVPSEDRLITTQRACVTNERFRTRFNGVNLMCIAMG